MKQKLLFAAVSSILLSTGSSAVAQTDANNFYKRRSIDRKKLTAQSNPIERDFFEFYRTPHSEVPPEEKYLS